MQCKHVIPSEVEGPLAIPEGPATDESRLPATRAALRFDSAEFTWRAKESNGLRSEDSAIHSGFLILAPNRNRFSLAIDGDVSENSRA